MRSAMAIAVLLAMAAPAGAGPPQGSVPPAGKIDTAKAAVGASDYFAARTAIAEALAAGDNSPEDMAELYKLSGIVSGALGDPKAATDAFQRCLALSPKAVLAVGTSPKIRRPFAAAQDFWKTAEPFNVKAETEASPPSVTVAVVDPLRLVARVRALVRVDGAPEQIFDRVASERTTITLPPAARLDVRIVALDATNNRLAEVGSKDVPIVIVSKAPPPAPVAAVTPLPPPRASSSRPFVLRWQLWAGVALAFGGAAAYFGIDSWMGMRDLDRLNANSPDHSFDEARRIEDRARRSVLFANIGFGTAGGFAIGAAILFLTRPRTAEQRLGLAPASDGAVIVYGGSF